MISLFNKNSKQSKNSGFTLLELLVSISIFAILTGIVMFNHGKFNSSINVTNLAYEVALAVRQAQVYGLAVKQDAIIDGSEEYAYGVYFSSDDNKKFYIFADRDKDQQFNPNPTGGDNCDGTKECQEVIEIRGDVSVRKLSTDTMNSSDGTDELTILFLRPNPVAIIRDTNNSGATSPGRNTANIELYSSRADKSKSVSVELSGQISVIN